MNYNPRYIAFAKFNGNTPEQQEAIDKTKSLRSFDFTMFIHKQKVIFTKLYPDCVFAGHIVNHEKFNEYLANL